MAMVREKNGATSNFSMENFVFRFAILLTADTRNKHVTKIRTSTATVNDFQSNQATFNISLPFQNIRSFLAFTASSTSSNKHYLTHELYIVRS